jgi:hypothetical protein
MIKVFNILSRTFCLLLMIHLLAVSISNDYLLKLINNSNIEQTHDIEEDNDSKDKAFEFDDFDDEYLVNSLPNFNYYRTFSLQENLSTIAFQYLQIALPQSNNEILIPPPRA